MKAKGITRLGVNGHPTRGMSQWSEMPLVGDVVGNAAPTERFFRAFDRFIDSPCEVRAGVWEATAYAEKITDYPYNEIVFVVEGSISIFDEDEHEERFDPGDCFPQFRLGLVPMGMEWCAVGLRALHSGICRLVALFQGSCKSALGYGHAMLWEHPRA